MVADQRQHLLEPLRSALSLLVAPLHYLASLPDGVIRTVRDLFTPESTLRQDNASLQAENLTLKGRLQRLESLEAENRRLHDLLGSSFRVGERVLIAELLSVDLDPYRHQVLIDKGGASGVFIGQPVLDAKAVMGQVVRVGPTTATVLLISDAAHGLPVRVNRNGLRAVARGTGLLNQLDLAYVPHDADLAEGDLLVTSGLGGRFPAGYPVARVNEVKRESGQPFARVTATPLAQLDSGHEALLVWTLPEEGADGGHAREGEDGGEEEAGSATGIGAGSGTGIEAGAKSGAGASNGLKTGNGAGSKPGTGTKPEPVNGAGSERGTGTRPQPGTGSGSGARVGQ